MNRDLNASHRHCQRIARRSASNFYWSFHLLPREKRRAMCALYAFARCVDDDGDSDQDTATRAGRLRAWREKLAGALQGEYDGWLWPALHDTVQRFAVAEEHLFAIIDGVEMDLSPRRYESFAELTEYCDRVAAAVGWACLPIWGCSHASGPRLARHCGIAFQLTNILRDLAEDARRGRVYLPCDEMRRFGCDSADLAAGRGGEPWRSFLRFQTERAAAHFNAGAPLMELLDRESRACFRLMFLVYHRLLLEIEQRGDEVLRRRVRLSNPRRLWLVATAVCGGGWRRTSAEVSTDLTVDNRLAAQRCVESVKE